MGAAQSKEPKEKTPTPVAAKMTPSLPKLPPRIELTLIPAPAPPDKNPFHVGISPFSYQVGATSLAGRLIHNQWPYSVESHINYTEYYTSTMNQNHAIYTINDRELQLILHDVCGRHDVHWRHLQKREDFTQYDAAGIVFVYDITNAESWEATKELVQLTLSHKFYDDISMYMLLGNKSDRGEDREVKYLEAKSFANENGIILVEVSAKDGTNVEFAFVSFIARLMEKMDTKPTV